ncbi:MAG TPA: DNA mismatch repair protein MutL, partial [Candidatus Caccousia stercoris]|nr:DNA mismatch repair protein MutL [Candidatus Caccousia stercoris]
MPFPKAPALSILSNSQPGDTVRFSKTPRPDSMIQPEQTPEPETQPEPSFRLVGEAFGTYVILESGDDLIWIDKHAAHERMIYEKLKAERGDADCQLLLEPVSVALEKNEYAAVLEARELCRKAGFEIDDFGAGTVLVRTAPLILEGEGIADAVMEIAGYLMRSKTDLT